MNKISRRKFLYIFASLSLSPPLSIVTASSGKNMPGQKENFPLTSSILKSAYESEKVASEHYIGYSRIAVKEKYPNIAYLFSAFADSEKIHAENYKRMLFDHFAESDVLPE